MGARGRLCGCEVGRGTRFVIRVPLTLAILPTLLIEIDDDVYALPLVRVIEVLSHRPERARWIDGQRVQRPGAPLKHFDSMTIYHPHDLTWEVEGELTDSMGEPKLQHSPVETIRMGVR